MYNNYHIKALKELSDLLASKEHLLSDRKIQNFESELCSVFGVSHAIAVNSGTSAIHCSLVSCGVKEGDEVIVPAFSLVMTVAPILYQKAIPVFVDCKPNKVDFDEHDLVRKITSKTKAIIAVHLWGYSNNMPFILHIASQNNIFVIEDACQAHGSKWGGKYLGTWGHLGCFSMKDGKIISTGEGGFILTNHEKHANICRALRTHNFNRDPQRSYQECGFNYRLTEFQAILASHQLRIFDKLLEQRRFFYDYIFKSLSPNPHVLFYEPYSEELPNYHSPVFLTKKGKEISERLDKVGIKNSVGSFGLSPTYQKKFLHQYNRINLPNVSRFLDQTIALLLLPTYSNATMKFIAQKVSETIKKSYE